MEVYELFVLYVKEILTAKYVVWCRCLSSGVNCAYYVLKSWIFVEVDDLLISPSAYGHPRPNRELSLGTTLLVLGCG